MKKLTLRLDEETHNLIKLISVQEGVSLQQMLINAIDETYGEKMKIMKKVKELVDKEKEK